MGLQNEPFYIFFCCWQLICVFSQFYNLYGLNKQKYKLIYDFSYYEKVIQFQQFQQQDYIKYQYYLIINQMKFTKSQRIIHQTQYNPPCTLYNIDKKINDKQILSGSLAGPMLTSKQKNTFGYDRRFDLNHLQKSMPGPGEYFKQTKQIVYNFNKDLSKPKQFLKETYRGQQPTVSIPYSVLNEENLKEDDKKFLRELALLQNPSLAAQNLHKKQPSYSFSKSPRKIVPQMNEKSKKQIVLNELEKIKQNQLIYQQRKQHNQIQSQSVKKGLILVNQKISKATKQRKQIINNIGPDFVPSLELIQLMSKMRTKYIPGPGAYASTKQIQQINLNTINKKGISFTALKRFKIDKQELVGPGSYNIENNNYSKKGISISTQVRRLFPLSQSSTNRNPFYINPTAQKPLTSSFSQRSSSLLSLHKPCQPTGFGSNSRRFSTTSLTKQSNVNLLSEYQEKKKNIFKEQLKKKIRKLSHDRRSTKDSSGLLNLQTMCSAID